MNPDHGDHLKPKMPAQVACSQCERLVPSETAIAPEAHEYVLYFCGADCHAEWVRQHPKGVRENAGRATPDEEEDGA
jgi:hypothetical protein